MDLIRQTQFDISKDLNEIDRLQKNYENAINSTHANSSDAIEAYHLWFDKVSVVCNRAFGSDDSDLKQFRSVNNSGNVSTQLHFR